MSRRSRLAGLCALVLPLLLTLAVAAAPPSNASGSLTVNGAVVPLRHAYAFNDVKNGSVRVFITSAPVAAASLAAEIPLLDSRGQSSLREAVRKGALSAIELFVRDGNMETVMVFSNAFDEPTPCSGDNAYWFEPYRMATGWTGARSRTKEEQEFFDKRWEYEVSYFAPVGRDAFTVPAAEAIEAQRTSVDAREKARIVPPGGGEEGAMYLAFYRNMEATNSRALAEQMTPRMKQAVAEQMQVAQLTPTELALFAMSGANPPGKIEIVGGVRDANETLLELRKTMGKRRRFGTATLVREGGAWKVDAQHWW